MRANTLWPLVSFRSRELYGSHATRSKRGQRTFEARRGTMPASLKEKKGKGNREEIQKGAASIGWWKRNSMARVANRMHSRRTGSSAKAKQENLSTLQEAVIVSSIACIDLARMLRHVPGANLNVDRYHSPIPIATSCWPSASRDRESPDASVGGPARSGLLWWGEGGCGVCSVGGWLAGHEGTERQKRR